MFPCLFGERSPSKKSPDLFWSWDAKAKWMLRDCRCVCHLDLSSSSSHLVGLPTRSNRRSNFSSTVNLGRLPSHCHDIDEKTLQFRCSNEPKSNQSIKSVRGAWLAALIFAGCTRAAKRCCKQIGVEVCDFWNILRQSQWFFLPRHLQEEEVFFQERLSDECGVFLREKLGAKFRAF